MKKSILMSVLLFAIAFSVNAQWTTNSYGIYPLNLNHHLSVGVYTPNTPMEFTVKGQQIIYGPEASLLFGGLENTTVGWGQYGIEYNVSAGGLNFWKPWGSNGAKNWVLFLHDDGRVGIGTNVLTDGFKLTVAGGINAQRVLITELAGADFVFENGFHLMSLLELEQFVKNNKHLPDVPSAKEMEENGLDMGEFQILLLQKVEELSLYIIQQQKEIDELKAHLPQAQ